MSDKIKVFALGGLDENGKNITIVEINDDIFVLDAGIKYPDKRVPGVDCIIPDFSYLKENASRVKAYIISHAHNDQMGAIPYLYRRVPAPIYCSKLTAALIQSKTVSYGLKKIDYDIHIVKDKKVMIANREFIFISMTHSIPGTFAVAIDTSTGYIVYSSDFIIDYGANEGNRMDLTTLSSLPLKKQILLLMSESCAADKPGHTSPNHRIYNHIERLFRESKGRIFISVYSQNLFNLREILDLAVKTNKKIIFLTDDAKHIFGDDIEHSDFNLPMANRTTINEINRHREQDLLIVVDGEGEQIFNNLISLAQGAYPFITFNENDTFVLASPSVPGTETASIDAIDNIYKTGAKIINLTRKEIYSMHAREEDLKMLLTILRPKYYLPIKGDYRQLLANAEIALKLNMGYNHSNIFVLDNGIPLNIISGVGRPDYSNTIQNGDILVDGIGVGNVVDSVIEERIKMANDGVIILGAVVSTKEKKIITTQDVQMRGFVFLKDSESIVKAINSIFEDSLHTYISSYYEENKQEFIDKISDRIIRFVRRETKKQPLVIPTIIDIDSK